MRIITDLPYPINIEEPTDMNVVSAKQNDSESRWYKATVYKGSDSSWKPDEGVPTVKFRKADGHGGWYEHMRNGDPAVTISGNEVTFGAAEQVFACAGRAIVAIVWYSSEGELLSSFNIYFQVEEDPVGHFTSTDYYNVLSLQMASVLNAASNLKGLTVEANTLEFGTPATADVTGGDEDNPYHITFGIPAGPLEALTAEVTALEPGEEPTVDLTGGGTSGDPYCLDFGLPLPLVGPPGVAVQSTTPENGELVWIDTSSILSETMVPEMSLRITTSLEALPKTLEHPKINEAMSVIGAHIENTANIHGNLAYTTYNGSMEIRGTLLAPTTITMVLAEAEDLTL